MSTCLDLTEDYLVALVVVAIAQRRLGPSSSATASTVERAVPALAVQARCWAPTTPQRPPPITNPPQALERIQKIRRMWLDRPEQRTHDYVRHGDFASVSDLVTAIGASALPGTSTASRSCGPSPPMRSSPSSTVKPPQRRSTSLDIDAPHFPALRRRVRTHLAASATGREVDLLVDQQLALDTSSGVPPR